jgi:hypothetical protein
MAAVQSYFEQFHSNIRLDENDENAKLREKRDILLKDLRENLPDDMPSFESFHQGSYSMNTGTVPLDGNYDIDVGIIFDCKKNKFSDPVELKKKVRDALEFLNRSVCIRRPCVTVNYLRSSEPEYHVDLAIYVRRDDDMLDLAMGKEHSEESKRVYQVSEPKRLTNLIINKFSGDDAAQFRRCIRYLKRWRDVQFSNGGAPLSIALTVAAYHWFHVSKDPISGKYVDLVAMRMWVTSILDHFSYTVTDDGSAERLTVGLPVQPYTDLMAKLSNMQMEMVKTKLATLYDALVAASEEALPEEACKKLKAQFGDEYPVPTKEETAKAVSAPYVSTGTSA